MPMSMTKSGKENIRKVYNKVRIPFYWTAALAGAYLFSGKAQEIADSTFSKLAGSSTEAIPSALEAIVKKISDTGADLFLAAGMGITAIAAGYNKPWIYGMIGLGVSQLDNFFCDFATKPEYGFGSWGSDILKDSGLMTAIYFGVYGAALLKKRAKDKSKKVAAAKNNQVIGN